MRIVMYVTQEEYDETKSWISGEDYTASHKLVIQQLIENAMDNHDLADAEVVIEK